ncbi:MAG: hypothetical protein ACP5KV_07265, partial [Candidatus Methanomethylicaceae archaeon]
PRNASIVEQVLLRLNRETKTTVIMSTHNMFQAERVAQRVAALDEGKIKAVGSFREVFGYLNLTSV